MCLTWLPGNHLLWRIIGSAFLLIAVAHGTHGLVAIADDYIVTPRGRNIVRVLSILMVIAMTAMGLYII